jgi:hypothetical protein
MRSLGTEARSGSLRCGRAVTAGRTLALGRRIEGIHHDGFHEVGMYAKSGNENFRVVRAGYITTRETLR